MALCRIRSVSALPCIASTCTRSSLTRHFKVCVRILLLSGIHPSISMSASSIPIIHSIIATSTSEFHLHNTTSVHAKASERKSFVLLRASRFSRLKDMQGQEYNSQALSSWVSLQYRNRISTQFCVSAPGSGTKERQRKFHVHERCSGVDTNPLHFL